MFFAEVFPFRCLLDVFDSMDGLRTLHNSVSVAIKYITAELIQLVLLISDYDIGSFQ